MNNNVVGSVFKPFEPSDITLKTFKVFKNWSCDESNYDSFGITLQLGISGSKRFYPDTDIQNSDGSYQKLVWRSISHLYYPTGSIDINTHEMDIYQNYINADKIHLVSRSLYDKFSIINIPHKVFGEEIKPSSVYIIDDDLGFTYVDDGNYNLYVSGTNNPRVIVGNVFYENGAILIHDAIGPELIISGNMETVSPSGWATTGHLLTSEITGEYKYSGSYSYHINPATSSLNDGIYQILSTLSNSRSYSMSFWVYITAGELLWQFTELGYSTIGETYSSSATQNQWHKISTTITPVTLGASPKLMFLNSSGSTSLNAYIDDVSIKQHYNSGEFITNDNFQLNFKGTQTINEYEIICNILESEFNYTMNPTSQVSGTINYIPLFSSSEIVPYITSIGLYNDNNELVMVGKLGQPFKRDYDLDTTFILKLDT